MSPSHPPRMPSEGVDSFGVDLRLFGVHLPWALTTLSKAVMWRTGKGATCPSRFQFLIPSS